MKWLDRKALSKLPLMGRLISGTAKQFLSTAPNRITGSRLERHETGRIVKASGGREYEVYMDGSLRTLGGRRPRGKSVRRKEKKARMLARTVAPF